MQALRLRLLATQRTAQRAFHAVAQQGAEVAEEDAGFGEIGNVSNAAGQVHRYGGPCPLGVSLIFQGFS